MPSPFLFKGVIIWTLEPPKVYYVTIVGRIYVYNGDYQRLVLLAYRFRKAVVKAIRMLAKGLSKDYVEKVVTELSLIHI